MSRFILVPTDFSPLAATAFPLAHELASGLDLPIRLLHAVELAVGPVGSELSDDFERQLRAPLERRLERQAAELEKGSGIPHNPVLWTGRAGTVVTREAAEGAEVVVMASHGLTALPRLWMGSVARRVLHGCGAPLLIVNRGACRPIRRVMFATDNSELAEPALDRIAPFLRIWRAPVELFHADCGPGPSGTVPELPLWVTLSPDVERRRHTIAERLEVLAERARANGSEVVTSYFEAADRAAQAIWARAQAMDADLIALASHGRGPLRRLWLGSACQELLARAALPVLIVRP